MPDAPHQLQLVLLEGHAAAPAVAGAPPGQFGRESIPGHFEPGRQALDDGHQSGPVRFTRGQEADHEPMVPRAAGPAT